MLEIAKNKLGNDATLILGDSERLPFEDSSFDAIVL
ncbi:MAG: methyltransferase domain-containing protein [Dorea sp.]